MFKNVDGFDVNLISEKSPIGYILDYDTEYPDELHSLHNDYPLATEHFAISYNILSDYCQTIAEKIWDKSWWYYEINSKFGQQN